MVVSSEMSGQSISVKPSRREVRQCSSARIPHVWLAGVSVEKDNLSYFHRGTSGLIVSHAYVYLIFHEYVSECDIITQWVFFLLFLNISFSLTPKPPTLSTLKSIRNKVSKLVPRGPILCYPNQEGTAMCRNWCSVGSSQSVTLAFSLTVCEAERQYWSLSCSHRGCYPLGFVKSYLKHLSHS